MAHSLSAKKRIRQNVKARARNRWRSRNYRGLLPEYHELILHGSVEDTQAKLSELYRAIDKAASHGPLHKNTASRYKARLAARLEKKKEAVAQGRLH